MIPAGTYKGSLRYRSGHIFVLSSCGVAGRDGDFLVEVNGVKAADGSANQHPVPSGRAAKQLGRLRPVRLAQARRQGQPPPARPRRASRQIRRAFYDSDDPGQCPDKEIVIVVRKGMIGPTVIAMTVRSSRSRPAGRPSRGPARRSGPGGRP